MKQKRISHNGYYGNYWAIVLGPKDSHIRPVPLRQFVRTAFRDLVYQEVCGEFPGRTIRVIRQPILPVFEIGM
jgi:hypothetical protein